MFSLSFNLKSKHFHKIHNEALTVSPSTFNNPLSEKITKLFVTILGKKILSLLSNKNHISKVDECITKNSFILQNEAYSLNI